GTTEMNVNSLKKVLPVVAALIIVGLPINVVLLGILGSKFFGFSLIISLVFAAMIVPTDPAAVLSVFHEFRAPEDLSVSVEGESILNDGVSVVVFLSLMAVAQDDATQVTDLATISGMLDLAFKMVVTAGGGLLVGGVIGTVFHRARSRINDGKALILLTISLAYGSFLISEHVFGFSGILAVVATGLMFGARTKEDEEDDDVGFMHDVWDIAAFLTTTMLYILIGLKVPFGDFIEFWHLIIVAYILTLFVRLIVTLPILSVLDRFLTQNLDLDTQTVFVWAGLHTVVPVALVLSLDPGFAHFEAVRSMVFGVVILSTAIQGLLMPYVLRATGIVSGS
ncbi:MAG: cation:proton antiporter, partial [Halobacteria archaeon]